MKNVCDHEGWLVDARELPPDPVDHDAEVLPTIGCTNLRCGLCGAQVRSVADRVLATPAGVDAEALYATSDLAASPLLRSSAGTRVYTCRCATHVESHEHRLDDKEGAAVATQWTCVGHPIATLPHVFDGVTVSADTLAQLVAEAMAGVVPAGARAADRTDGVWAARLCARLANTPHAARIASLVAEHLTHPDLATRVRALYFFAAVPSHAAAMRADQLLTAHAALFVGVANPNSNARATKTLELLVWRIAGAQLAHGSALRDVARAFATDAQRASKPVFLALAQHDAAWFAEHAPALVAASPARKQEILDAATGAQLSAEVIARIRAA